MIDRKEAASQSAAKWTLRSIGSFGSRTVATSPSIRGAAAEVAALEAIGRPSGMAQAELDLGGRGASG
jgi:hypothetical protein